MPWPGGGGGNCSEDIVNKHLECAKQVTKGLKGLTPLHIGIARYRVHKNDSLLKLLMKNEFLEVDFCEGSCCSETCAVLPCGSVMHMAAFFGLTEICKT
jgi:hypothetical protein